MASIIDDLHSNLGMLLGDYDVLQVKEQRRWVLHPPLTSVSRQGTGCQALHAIGDAERQSLLTCEGCGEDGDTQYHGGWYKTLCAKHHEEEVEALT